MNGLVNGLANGLVFGLVVGLVAGSVVGLTGTFGERPPRHLSRPRLSKANIPISLAFGLSAGLIYGLAAGNGFATVDAGSGIERGIDASIGKGAEAGIVAGLTMLVIVSLAVWLVVGLGRPSTQATSPIDPRSSWRRNRQFGFTVGLVGAIAYAIVQSLMVGLTFSLIVAWAVSGLAMGVAVGLVFPATWQVTLASAQLWRRGEAPTRFLRFLEDTHDRQILRTVGQVYQFRHGQLQDRLACLRVATDSGTVPESTIHT